MGLMDNFSQNVGGARGGLLAAGDALGLMAQSMAENRPGQNSGMRWGQALGIGSRSLIGGFEKQREAGKQRQIQTDAQKKADALPEGSQERDYWLAIASGNPEQTRLLPPYWAAKEADKRTKLAGGGQLASGPQLAKNRKIFHARSVVDQLNADPSMKGRMLSRFGIDGLSGILNDARTSYTNEPDPDYLQYADKASYGPLHAMIQEARDAAAAEAKGEAPPAEAEEPAGDDIPFVPSFLEPVARSVGDFFGGDEPAEESSMEGNLAAELEAALGGSATPGPLPPVNAPPPERFVIPEADRHAPVVTARADTGARTGGLMNREKSLLEGVKEDRARSLQAIKGATIDKARGIYNRVEGENQRVLGLFGR